MDASERGPIGRATAPRSPRASRSRSRSSGGCSRSAGGLTPPTWRGCGPRRGPRRRRGRQATGRTARAPCWSGRTKGARSPRDLGDAAPRALASTRDVDLGRRAPALRRRVVPGAPRATRSPPRGALERRTRPPPRPRRGSDLPRPSGPAGRRRRPSTAQGPSSGSAPGIRAPRPRLIGAPAHGIHGGVPARRRRRPPPIGGGRRGSGRAGPRGAPSSEVSPCRRGSSGRRRLERRSARRRPAPTNRAPPRTEPRAGRAGERTAPSRAG